MLYSNDGQLLDVGRSGGQLPVEFRVRPPFIGKMLAVDARHGEGSISIRSDQLDPKTRVTLKRNVLDIKLPDTRVSAAELSDKLGTKLHAWDKGWVVDPQVGSPAAAAGLRRGDAIITAWRDKGAVRVVFWRKKAGYLDAVIK